MMNNVVKGLGYFEQDCVGTITGHMMSFYGYDDTGILLSMTNLKNVPEEFNGSPFVDKNGNLVGMGQLNFHF